MYFMTGLETIVEQILQEAQKEAEEIKAQAARNADSIIANAQKTVDKMNEETSEKVATMVMVAKTNVAAIRQM